MTEMVRWKLILGRWRDIALLTALGSIATIYIEPLVTRLAALLQAMGDGWNGWFILCVYLAIPLGIGALLRVVGGFRFRDFDIIASFANPPTWYAGLLGMCLLPFLGVWLDTGRYLGSSLSYWNLLLWVLFIALCTGGHKLWQLVARATSSVSGDEAAGNAGPTRRERIGVDMEEYIKWLLEEKPIQRPEEDMFGAATTARRIVRTLTGKTPRSISLVGQYGSGKTSILNLVRRELEKCDENLVVPISAWSHEDRKLIDDILGTAVKHISRNTDCLSICRVPVQFGQIFLNNNWGMLNWMKFLMAEETPEGLVRRIDETLFRSRKRLMIILEDLDRNHDSKVHQQLYSMFDYLAKGKHILFVLTYGENMVVEPLTKITGKTEVVPELDEMSIYDEIVRFREYCLTKYDDIAAPGLGKPAMDTYIGLLHSSGEDYHEMRNFIMMSRHHYGTASYTPIDCIVSLLRYPRHLKRAMGAAWTAWEKLHGEVCFDDLLALHTIKTSNGDLFHLMVSNRDLFKAYASSGEHRTSIKENKELYNRVEVIIANDPKRILYHILIRFLFPAWKIWSEDGASEIAHHLASSDQVHQQGVADDDGGVDYFSRALNEELREGELPDQYVMRQLLDCNNDQRTIADLAREFLTSDRFAERAERFGRLLRPAKILGVTSEYFKALAASTPGTGLRGQHGDTSLRQMSLNNPENRANHRQWVEEQLDIYAPKSLAMANDILDYWSIRTRHESKADRLPNDLYEMYVGSVKRVMEDSERFAAILKQDMPDIWLLWHIVSRFQGKNEVKKKKKDIALFALWQPWLADLLKKAAEMAPSIVAMYVAPLIYDCYNSHQERGLDDSDGTDSGITSTWRGSFDGEVGEMLFGQKLYDMMRIIAVLQEEDYSENKTLDEQNRALLDYAATHAKQWLKDNQGATT